MASDAVSVIFGGLSNRLVAAGVDASDVGAAKGEFTVGADAGTAELAAAGVVSAASVPE